MFFLKKQFSKADLVCWSDVAHASVSGVYSDFAVVTGKTTLLWLRLGRKVCKGCPWAGGLCLTPLAVSRLQSPAPRQLFLGRSIQLVWWFCWSQVLVPASRQMVGFVTAEPGLSLCQTVVWCTSSSPLGGLMQCELPCTTSRLYCWLSFCCEPVTNCIFLSCPGGGGVWSPGFGDVSVEPAGCPSSFHGVLACLICSSDIFLFQYPGPACLEREAPFPLLDKVIN